MKIRKLQEKDIGKIVAIIHDVMGPTDAKKALEDMKISLDPEAKVPYKFEEFYVIEVEDEIVAAGGFWSLKYDPHIARLDWFVVPQKYQRKGFGNILLNFIINRAKKRGLKIVLAETSDKYVTAVNFFKKCGFTAAAKISNYWEDGSGVVYLVRRLK
ncbi:MAG TPA: GNAT family N-acetyltransferase [archaeon]|nr:GNAT family N-acetyltransferase [archaeon]